MANFTKEGYFETVQVVACTASLYVNHYLYSLAAFNIILFITTTMGNILILAALHKESSLHPHSKLFFRCLTATDLLVGVCSQPLFVIQLISIALQQLQVCHTIVSLNDVVAKTLCAVSLWTLTGISVDRLLALLLGFRGYRHTVTSGRTRDLLICFWIVSILISCLNRFLSEHTIMARVYSAIIYLLLGISAFCYVNIYLQLRQKKPRKNHGRQGQQNGGRIPLNIARYRKTVSIALWVQVTSVACYLPYGIVSATGHPYTPTHNLAVRLGATCIFLNSTLNPFFYCWKIREVRQAVKEIIRHLCCES